MPIFGGLEEVVAPHEAELPLAPSIPLLSENRLLQTPTQGILAHNFGKALEFFSPQNRVVSRTSRSKDFFTSKFIEITVLFLCKKVKTGTSPLHE